MKSFQKYNYEDSVKITQSSINDGRKYGLKTRLESTKIPGESDRNLNSGKKLLKETDDYNDINRTNRKIPSHKNYRQSKIPNFLDSYNNDTDDSEIEQRQNIKVHQNRSKIQEPRKIPKVTKISKSVESSNFGNKCNRNSFINQSSEDDEYQDLKNILQSKLAKPKKYEHKETNNEIPRTNKIKYLSDNHNTGAVHKSQSVSKTSQVYTPENVNETTCKKIINKRDRKTSSIPNPNLEPQHPSRFYNAGKSNPTNNFDMPNTFIESGKYNRENLPQNHKIYPRDNPSISKIGSNLPHPPNSLQIESFVNKSLNLPENVSKTIQKRHSFTKSGNIDFNFSQNYHDKTTTTNSALNFPKPFQTRNSFTNSSYRLAQNFPILDTPPKNRAPNLSNNLFPNSFKPSQIQLPSSFSPKPFVYEDDASKKSLVFRNEVIDECYNLNKYLYDSVSKYCPSAENTLQRDNDFPKQDFDADATAQVLAAAKFFAR